MQKIFTPLVLSAVLGSSAFGATVSLTQFVYGPVLADLHSSFSVPTIASLQQVVCPPGSTLVLNSVKLSMATEISAKGSLTHADVVVGNPAINGTITYSGPITVTVPGGVTGNGLSAAQFLQFGPIAVPAGGSAPFGPAGSGGVPYPDVDFAANVAQFFFGPDVILGISSTITTGLAGEANLGVSYNVAAFEGNFAQVNLDVTYDYTCEDIRVPEPKVYGLIGAALSLGVLGYRQYRSKKA